MERYAEGTAQQGARTDAIETDVPDVEAYLIPEAANDNEEPKKEPLESVPQPPSAQPESAEGDAYNRVKEQVLAAGGMTIEPLRGDPFVLSENHVPRPEGGVTVYHTDGSVELKSHEEHTAEMAKGHHAAYYFSRTRRESAANDTHPLGGSSRVARAAGWAKGKMKKLWSWLWK